MKTTSLNKSTERKQSKISFYAIDKFKIRTAGKYQRKIWPLTLVIKRLYSLRNSLPLSTLFLSSYFHLFYAFLSQHNNYKRVGRTGFDPRLCRISAFDHIGSGVHPASCLTGNEDLSLSFKRSGRSHITSTECPGWEYVELYLHIPVCLHGAVLTETFL